MGALRDQNTLESPTQREQEKEDILWPGRFCLLTGVRGQRAQAAK